MNPPQANMATALKGSRGAVYLIVGLCGIFIAALWSSTIQSTNSAREATRADARNETLALSQAAEAHALVTFRRVEQLLRLVKLNVERNPASAILMDINQIIASSALRASLEVLVIDSTRQVIGSSLPGEADPNDAGRSESFEFHATTTPKGLMYIGLPFYSTRFETAAIPLSYAIDGPRGEFNGIVLALLPTDFFGSFYGSLNLPDGSTVGLIRSDGVLLSRRGAQPMQIGQIAASAQFFEASRRSPVGSYETVSRLDGIRRTLSYRVNDELPFSVFVGFDVARYFSEVYAAERREFGYSTGFTVLSLLVAAFLILDIRRRRESAARIDELNQQFSAIAANVPGILYQRVMRPDGTLSYPFLSSGLKALIGIDPADVKRDPWVWLNRIHPDDRERALTSIRDSALSLAPWSIDVRMVRPDGEIVWCHSAMHTRRRADGNVVWDGFMGDITARIRGEEELKEARAAADAANRAKSEFLATMSHEIRTPMNGVIGFANVLLETPLNDEQKRHATTIRDAARALLVLLNDILDYSKIEAGRIDLDEVAFPPASLVDGVLSIVRESATAKNLELVSIIEPSVPQFVIGDDHRLRQVLLNLVGNAVKFTARGRVTVRVLSLSQDATRPSLRFEVEDTGEGITPEAQSRLFDRFVQADASVSRKFGGSGLGLSISKRLVELMGGTIGVDSTPGKGSVFWFCLDMKRATVAENPAQLQSSVAGGAHIRILLVDDVEMNRRLVSLMLRGTGHAVETADSGAAAIDAVRTKDYDLVLMDIQMPDMDGYEATARIHALPGDNGLTPIVAMTANAMSEDVKRCLDAGMADHVAKPIEKTVLLNVIAKHGRRRTTAAGH